MSEPSEPAPEKAPRRPPRRRRLLRRFALAVVAVLVLVYAALQTAWGRERVRRLVIDVVHDQLGLEARIDAVAITIGGFPPALRISAEDIELHHPREGRLARVERLVIRPSLTRLLVGQVDLRSIELVHPDVRLVVRNGQLVNGPVLPEGDGSPVVLPFRYLEVVAARIAVESDVGLAGHVEGLDVEVGVTGGTSLDVQLEARAGELRHPRGVEPLQRLLLAAHVDIGRSIRVDELVLRTPHARVAVEDARVPLPIRERYEGSAEVRVDLAHLARSLPEDLGVPPLDGIATISAELRAHDGLPVGTARVQLDDVHVDGYGLGEAVDLRVRLDEERATILEGSTFRFVQDGGLVGLTGSVGLATPFPVEARLDVTDLQFAKLMDQLGVTPNAIVWWFFTGHIRLAGSLSPLSLEGPIEVDTRDFFVSQGPWHARPRERVIGVPHGRIVGRVELDTSALGFVDLTLTTQRSRVSADVIIGFGPTFEVHARTDAIDVADVSPLLDIPLEGVGSAVVDVVGTYSDPQLSGHAALRGFSFDGLPFGDIESDMVLEEDGDVARFPELRGTKGDSRYVVRDLRLDFREHFAATAEVELTTLSLADAYHTFHLDQDERFTPYRAVGRGSARVRYSVGFPTDLPSGTLITDLRFDIARADFAGFAFEDGVFEGQFRWIDYDRGIDGSELDIDRFELKKGDASIAASGAIGQNGALRLGIAADHVSFADTEGLGDRFPLLAGHFSMLGEVRGTVSVPRMDLDVSITNVVWGGQLVGDGRAYVRLTERDDPWVRAALAWDPEHPPADEPCAGARLGFARGHWPADPPIRTQTGYVPSSTTDQAFLVCGAGFDGTMALDLALGWTRTFAHRGVVRFDRLALAPFLPTQPDGSPSQGQLTGEVVLTDGALLADDSSSGRVRFDRLVMRSGDVSVENRGPIELDLVRGYVRVRQAEIASEDTVLRASGGGSFHGYDLSLEGRVGMGSLATLAPMMRDAQGAVDVAIHVRGSYEDPAVFGEARLEDVSFAAEGMPSRVTGLAGTVEFSERRIELSGFHASLGGGTLELSGSATMGDGEIQGYDIALDARDVSVRPDQGLEVAFGGHWNVTWRHGRRLPMVRGRLVLDRVRYTHPVNLAPTLGELYRPRRATVESYDPAADHAELDIEVTMRSPVMVRNNLVDLDIAIEDTDRPFRVVGTDQRMGVVGSLTVPRGIVRFRSAAFEVRRGNIDFEDPTRIDPRFEILATTDIQRNQDPAAPQWRIQLLAAGTLDGFRLEASSVPQMPQQDIMLLLMVGMTSSELQQLQASNLSSAALEALSALSGVEGRIGNALRIIDDVSLTTVYHPQTNRPEPQVTIGKRLSDRIRLTASTGLTSETRSIRTTAEWRLNDQLRLQAGYDNLNRGTSSSFGNIGVDVRWHIEFE